MEEPKKYLGYLLRKEQWTDEEKQWLLDYLAEGDVQVLYELAREQYGNDLSEGESPLTPEASRSLLEKIHGRIGESELRVPLLREEGVPRRHLRRERGRGKRLYRLTAAAAAVILLLAGTAAWYFRPVRLRVPAPGQVCLLEARTGEGERKEVELPDGTRAWLSPASRLEYPEAFDGDIREVFLTGEAFFEVVGNPACPFLIRSGLIETRVIGTAFNVKAYERFDRLSVTVVRGKVAVSSVEKTGKDGDAGQLEISSDQRAVFNKKEKAFTVEADPDASLMLARRNGLLIYKGATLTTIIEDLSVQYGKKIVLRGGIGKCRYYGRFSVEDGLEDSLRQIYLTLGATLTREGDVLVLSGDSC